MKPPCCSLPWCGRTGKIDAHHIVRRSQGGSDDESNIVYLCHECHVRHHSDARYQLTFYDEVDADDVVYRYVERADGKSGPVFVYNEYDQGPSPQTPTEDEGVELHRIERVIAGNSRVANDISWENSHLLYAASRIVDDVYEWAANLDEPLSRRTVDVMLATRILPDACSALSLSQRRRLLTALQSCDDIERLVADVQVLHPRDFEKRYPK